jgi:hypothetical protein
VQWTRLAYNSDPAEPFGNFSGLIPWEAPAGPVPPYPYASNMADAPVTDPYVAGGGGMGPETSTTGSGLQAQDLAALREEIRRLVIEELSQLVGGERRG